MKYQRRKIEKWKWDSLKISTGVLFLTVLLSIFKQNYKEPEYLSPEATGEVTVITRTETKIETIDVAEIVDKIHLLESSRGKAKDGLHIFCRNKGMSNEYGYGGMRLKLCFRTHKEATAMIHLWFNTQLENKTLGQAVCYYQSGVPHEGCQYYQKFLSINE